jgi:hypothetical protein
VTNTTVRRRETKYCADHCPNVVFGTYSRSSAVGQMSRVTVRNASAYANGRHLQTELKWVHRKRTYDCHQH